MKLKKILWPTDFSGSAQQAVPMVKSLAEKYQIEIHVLYVIEKSGQPEPGYSESYRSYVEKLRDEKLKEAEERLGEICEKFLTGCPLFIKHIAVGDPVEEILKFIQKEKVDIVVMASRARRRYHRYGSITEKVTKNASVPVITVPVDYRE